MQLIYQTFKIENSAYIFIITIVNKITSSIYEKNQLGGYQLESKIL